MIKGLAIIRSSDKALLYKNKNNIDVSQVLSHMDTTKPRPEEKVTLKTAQGKWSYKLDDNKIAYCVLTIESYPDRQQFAMIKEMERELKKMPDYSYSGPQEIEKYAKIWAKDLQEKYENLSSIDKVAEAQLQVDSVQLIMEDNVKKMLDNGAQIDVLY